MNAIRSALVFMQKLRLGFRVTWLAAVSSSLDAKAGKCHMMSTNID